MIRTPTKGPCPVTGPLTFYCGPAPGLDTGKKTACICTYWANLISKAYFYLVLHLILTAATRERQAGHQLSCSVDGKLRPRQLGIQADLNRKRDHRLQVPRLPSLRCGSHTPCQLTASYTHTTNKTFQAQGEVMIPTPWPGWEHAQVSHPPILQHSPSTAAAIA